MVQAIEDYKNAPGTVAMRKRLESVFTHTPKTENALRNMEEEKLCKILAARPELIPPQSWTSTPEMYDLYVKARSDLGLPATVKEAVQQDADIRDPMTNKTFNARQAVLKDMGYTEEQFNEIIKPPEPLSSQPFNARAAVLKDMGYTEEQFNKIIESPKLLEVPKTDPRVQAAEETSPGKSFGDLAGEKLNQFGDYMSGQFDRLTKKPEGVVPASNIRKYTDVGSPVDYNGTIESAMASRDKAFSEFKNAQKAWSNGELDQSDVDALWNKFSRLDALVDKTQKNPRSQESVADAKAIALGDKYNPATEYPPGVAPVAAKVKGPSEDTEFGSQARAENNATPYDRFVRPKIDKNAPVGQQYAQNREFEQNLDSALRDVKVDLASKASGPQGSYHDPITGALIQGPNSDYDRYNQAQLKQVQEERQKAKQLLDVFNAPEARDILYKNPQVLMLAQADPEAAAKELNRIVKGEVAPKAGVAGVSGVAAGDSNPAEGTGPVTPVARQSPANPDREAGAATGSVTAGGERYGMSMEDELASVRRSAVAAPKAPQVAPRSETGSATAYRGPTTVVDPLTRKAYAPISQSSSPSYRNESEIMRSGLNGEETPLDFVRNADIYKKRLEEQPPMEARGGPISNGGSPIDAKCHTGIIHMAVGGRTDHLPMNVYANSYVLPADVVSGLGEGNTLAGAKIIDHMFSGPSLQRLANKTVKDPLKRASGGETAARDDSGPTYLASPSGFSLAPSPKLSFGAIDMMGTPYGVKSTDTRASAPRYPEAKYSWRYNPPKPGEKPQPQMARGGMADDRSLQPVEIVAAGGEYVVPPEVVRALGHGDAERGHEWLDTFVKSSRSHIIKTMKNLPGPKKD